MFDRICKSSVRQGFVGLCRLPLYEHTHKCTCTMLVLWSCVVTVGRHIKDGSSLSQAL